MSSPTRPAHASPAVSYAPERVVRRVGAHDHPACLPLWQAPDPTVDVPGAVVGGLSRLAACCQRLCGLGGRVRDPADPWEPGVNHVLHIRVVGDASVRHRHPWGLIRRTPWLLDGLDSCHHTSRVARIAMKGLEGARKRARDAAA
jgi:hypothetical protein